MIHSTPGVGVCPHVKRALKMRETREEWIERLGLAEASPPSERDQTTPTHTKTRETQEKDHHQRKEKHV